MKYGYTITWSDSDGAVSHSSSGHETIRDAVLTCLESSKKFGWTSPKWWEFCRWGEKTEKQILRDAER